MSATHDELAFRTGRWMLKELRAGVPAWSVSDLTVGITLGSWFESWPRPDMTYFDATSNRSLAVEFKPPGHAKREYVTGLGQCLTYLNAFDYAILVTPDLSIDGFAIADYLGDTVRAYALQKAPLGVLSYTTDPEIDMGVVEGLRARTGTVARTPTARHSFWGYWRDLSQFDLFQILALVDQRGTYEIGWPEFWRSFMLKGKARLWTGNYRSRYSPTSEDAQKLNARLSLRHANLIEADGTLTQRGLELLHLGKVYGPDSAAFMAELARRILDDARHIELIYWISEVQSNIKTAALKSADSYLLALEKLLVLEGVIQAPTGHSKPAFIRDEPKLWNKLNLLRRRSATQYFWPGQGFVFDWRRITGILSGP